MKSILKAFFCLGVLLQIHNEAFACDWEVSITNKTTNEVKHYKPTKNFGTKVVLPLGNSLEVACCFDLDDSLSDSLKSAFLWTQKTPRCNGLSA